jgi:prophage regulatory protein
MDHLPPRIISWSTLRTIVPYTRQHILRLEAAGKFPRRIQVGENRVGWLVTEVEAWIDARVLARDELSPTVHGPQT